MKTAKRLAAAAMAVMTAGMLSVAALAADGGFGSAAVEENGTYSLSEMLTYAIQDEYLAYAEYGAIIGAYGAQRPFTNILKAEAAHISALEPLFAEYGAAVPENTAGEHTVLPGTLLDAYRAGAEAEISNIAMYEAFLKQDLPEDARRVFASLKNASENHLAAFERGISRLEDGGNAGAGSAERRNRGGAR